MVETKVCDFSLVSKVMPVKHATLVVVYSEEVMIVGVVLGFKNNTSMKGLNPTVQRFAILSSALCLVSRKIPLSLALVPIEQVTLKYL